MNLRRAANVHDQGSLSNRMRSRRFAIFESLASHLARPLRIIDIGGTNAFWEQRGWARRKDVRIVLVNLQAEPQLHENIESRVGNATCLSTYADKEFDVAFSNSVIEHLATNHAQQRMANEVRRLATAYWVQTPNYWFPIEPHFHVPGWQWMPVKVRVWMLRRFRCGWNGPEPDEKRARATVEEVRLLRSSDMKRLFPGASIWHEKFCGMTKSLVAYAGFPT